LAQALARASAPARLGYGVSAIDSSAVPLAQLRQLGEGLGISGD
jgi:hypothetical protein